MIEGYGKVLRSALDLKTRELCIIALLASQDAPHQLHSHLRGALTGATTAEVDGP
jgi:4-carboxymuconolactone decarboxylase